MRNKSGMKIKSKILFGTGSKGPYRLLIRIRKNLAYAKLNYD
jgi:hypothetical protein